VKVRIVSGESMFDNTDLAVHFPCLFTIDMGQRGVAL